MTSDVQKAVLWERKIIGKVLSGLYYLSLKKKVYKY